jgi:O-methyltransferase
MTAEVQSPNTADMYLTLMKKALAYMLWDEVGSPIETFNYRRSLPKRLLVSSLVPLLNRRKIQLLRMQRWTDSQRENGGIYPAYAHTMIGIKRLDNLQFCIEHVIRNGIEGDLIETGVWRGGACIFMRAVLAAYGVKNRRVFVADSFQGLPKPDERFPQDKNDKLYTERYLAISQEEVARNFENYGLLDDQVVFLKGWFKDTLPKASIKKLAVLRLDGDMYQSTMEALTNLYHKLQVGGFCIVDDYNLYGCGCKQAVDDFRRENDVSNEIQKIDYNAVFWKKLA